MASLTLKNLPDPLLGRLRQRAELDRRSLTQEILYLLEAGLDRTPVEAGFAEEARAQVEAWSSLAGRWCSDLETDQEIEQILSSRTRGRKTEL